MAPLHSLPARDRASSVGPALAPAPTPVFPTPQPEVTTDLLSRLVELVAGRATSRPAHAEAPAVPKSTPPAVLAAAPVLQVLAVFDALTGIAAMFDPHGATRHAFAFAAGQLRHATTLTEPIDACGDVDWLVQRTGRSRSTVTDWCARYGDGLWARKHAATWLVTPAEFDTWYEKNREALDRRRRPGSRTRTEPMSDGGAGAPATTEKAA